jgi:hypothetical protein
MGQKTSKQKQFHLNAVQTEIKFTFVCFYISKVLLKKIEIFYFFIYFKLFYFSVFSDYFDILISKIIFFKKIYYFDAFSSKKHFKNNHYHTHKHQSLSSVKPVAWISKKNGTKDLKTETV